MYNEILGPLLNRKSVSTDPLLPSIPLQRNNATKSRESENSSSFESSLLSRLTAAEIEAKTNRKRLEEQIEINCNLEKENEDLKIQIDSPDEVMYELKECRKQNSMLKQKVQEMEKFLSDYGLVWVGSDGQNLNIDDNDEEEYDIDEKLTDYFEFKTSIDDLNAIVYSDPAKVIREGENNNRARLAQAAECVEHIKLTFYKNGIMIKRGPFRYNYTDSYKTFVRDIIDGYFPSEFREEYPDGVIFDLYDKHEEDYRESDFGEDQLSVTTFLNRLPNQIMRNGEICNVKDDIATKLGRDLSSNKQNSKVVAKSRVIELPTRASTSTGNIAEVLIKWHDKRTFLAKMEETDTIGDLKSELMKCKDFITTDDAFQFRSAYPPRILKDSMTLKEADLVPNGTVHAQKVV